LPDAVADCAHQDASPAHDGPDKPDDKHNSRDIGRHDGEAGQHPVGGGEIEVCHGCRRSALAHKNSMGHGAGRHSNRVYGEHLCGMITSIMIRPRRATDRHSGSGVRVFLSPVRRSVDVKAAAALLANQPIAAHTVPTAPCTFTATTVSGSAFSPVAPAVITAQ